MGAAEPPVASVPTRPVAAPRADAKVTVRKIDRIKDDREELVKSGRTMLVIEDDEHFAGILYP